MTGAARLASVDALRGLTVAAMLLVNNPGDWAHVYAPLLHADWHGFTPTDLIFPLFLFIVGVSIALGVQPHARDDRAGKAAVRSAVLWRALRIILVGLGLHLLAWWWLDLAHYRPWGVLQRIGLCFAVVGVLALYSRAGTHWRLLGVLLTGYAAVLVLGGSLLPLNNVASRVDTALFAPWLYYFNPKTGLGHDPEGLLSTVGALCSTLFGLCLGQLLRQGRWQLMAGLAALALLLGGVWGLALPLNKHLWTPSYVLLTGGCAGLMLVLMHRLVDVHGWPALGRRFGVNAITAYAGSSAMVLALTGLGWWDTLYRLGVARWMVPLAGAQAASLLFAVMFVLLWWWPMWWLDRQRLYLKI